jgi:hypothetical protein
MGQKQPIEERCPNDRFLISKQTLRDASVNDRSWPK